MFYHNFGLKNVALTLRELGTRETTEFHGALPNTVSGSNCARRRSGKLTQRAVNNPDRWHNIAVKRAKCGWTPNIDLVAICEGDRRISLMAFGHMAQKPEEMRHPGPFRRESRDRIE